MLCKRTSRRIRLPRDTIVILLSIFLLAGCGAAQDKAADQPATDLKKDTLPANILAVQGNFSDELNLRVDSQQISAFFKKFPQLSPLAADVGAFYNYRSNHYAWYNGNGLTEQADNLFNHLSNLTQEGVESPVPYLDTLEKLVNDPLAEEPDANIEILLSAEYLFYAQKVWRGLPEQQTTKLQWYLSRKKMDLPYLADSLLKDSAASLFSGSFNYRQYNLLKAALKQYRSLDSFGFGKPIPIPAVSVRKNDSSKIIPAVRHRLFLFGDLGADNQSEYYDDSLEAAVKSFQQRYGLTVDGIMGKNFIQELNTPPEEYIRKIIVNMERSRWIPVLLHNEYLVVNIPAFRLSVYSHDTVAFSMNVVVGRDIHKTVVFNGNLKYIVFSPYWSVPNSILKKEILPAIKRDPNYLKRNNMEWHGNTVRQKPGPQNSLGLVKFLFPNSYNIYLHDSPAKSLFNQTTRAFSHGCIRLAEPKKLAEFLLRDDPSWTPAKITAAMNRGKEQYVTLKNPVPVYIGYLTAWVDTQGRLNFRKDIYKRDQELADMLIQR